MSTIESEPKILVVDDDAQNITQISHLLRKEGYRVIAATNGRDGLKLVDKKPDLVLLDIMMPGMDGYSVCRSLKSDPNNCDIPIIFLTAKNDVEDETMGLSLGAVDYITKPISPPVIRARVKTHLALRRAYLTIEKQRDLTQIALNLAKDVQQNLLPDRNPSISGLDIAGQSNFCDETGGDYYDFFKDPVNPNKIKIMIGDVSGHGVSTALLMATARAYLRLESNSTNRLDQIATHVNCQFNKDVTEGKFMTLFLCEIDANQKFIRWVRAGHDPAILFHSNTDSFSELNGEGGTPLGAFKEEIYQENFYQLSSGDILLIGTDGIWEARNHAGEMYGKDRLKEIIRSQADFCAEKILEHLFVNINEFIQNQLVKDDMTALIVKIM